jgi:hypothetical protein
MLATLAERNPQWLREHPEVARRFSGPGRLGWLSYGWGTVSLATLVAFQTGLWPQRWSPVALAMARWETLKELNTLLLVPGVIAFAITGLLFTRWLTSAVPLVDRRHATLAPRTLDDFVPRWAQIAVYAVATLSLAAWLVVAASGWNTTSSFQGRLAFILLMTPLFLLCPRVSVRRRPQAVDRIFGPAYRRTEVRYGMAMSLVLAVVGALQLYEELAGPVAFDISRVMHLGLVLCVTAGILRLARFAKDPGGPRVSGRVRAIECAA